MKLDNQWKRGRGEWWLPPLPLALIGKIGASLQRATFEERVGSEVFLALFEASDCSPLFLPPAVLNIRTGLANTRHGVVVFLIWYIVKDYRRIAWYEQFLNPLHRDVPTLLANAAGQQYLKVFTIDSSNGDVLGMDEFPNVFIEDKLVEAIQILPSTPSPNFQLAVEEFSREYSVEQFLNHE